MPPRRPLPALPLSLGTSITSGLSGVVIGGPPSVRAMSLAMIVRSRTMAIKTSAPAQARFCALMKPPVALPKICNDSVDMRLPGLVSTKRSLPSAVSRSGAVSPIARATASMTPVMMPALRRGQQHRDDRARLRDAEREAGLADVARHEPQHLLCRPHDQRHHHERRGRTRRRSRRTRTRRPTIA